MSDLNQSDAERLAAEQDAESRVDMWCSVAIVMLAWAIAMHWVSNL